MVPLTHPRSSLECATNVGWRHDRRPPSCQKSRSEEQSQLTFVVPMAGSHFPRPKSEQSCRVSSFLIFCSAEVVVPALNAACRVTHVSLGLVLRKREKWNCFYTEQSIGKLGYQKLGFHEEKKLKEIDSLKKTMTSNEVPTKSSLKRSSSQAYGMMQSPTKKQRSRTERSSLQAEGLGKAGEIAELENLGLVMSDKQLLGTLMNLSRCHGAKSVSEPKSGGKRTTGGLSALGIPFRTPTMNVASDSESESHSEARTISPTIPSFSQELNRLPVKGAPFASLPPMALQNLMNSHGTAQLQLSDTHSPLCCCNSCAVSRARTVSHYTYLNYLHMTANLLHKAHDMELQYTSLAANPTMDSLKTNYYLPQHNFSLPTPMIQRGLPVAPTLTPFSDPAMAQLLAASKQQLGCNMFQGLAHLNST